MSSSINGGVHMRVCPVRAYDCTGLAASAGTINIVLAEHIESGPFTTIDMGGRVHPSSTNLTGHTFSLLLCQDGYDFGDPSTTYITPSSPLMTVSLGTSAGVYKMGTSAGPFGRYVAVVLQIVIGSTARPVLYVSAELSLKGGDPNDLQMADNTFSGFRVP